MTEQRPRRLISLNWDHPLPSAIVTLTLRPHHTVLIAPAAAEQTAKQLRGVLEARGLAVELRLGESATDLDAGRPPRRMRRVIEQALEGDDTVLDYTGGSKLMSATARLALEPGGAARSVYLDVRTGLLRHDDGRSRAVSFDLGIVELAALHGSVVVGLGGKALADHEGLPDVLAAVRPLLELERAHPGARRLFAPEVIRVAEQAQGRLPRDDRPWDRRRASDEQRRSAERELDLYLELIGGGAAYMLPLSLDKAGDWLELSVADALQRTLSHAGAAARVRVSVEARRQHGELRHRMIREQPPAIRRVLLALRALSTGRAGEEDVRDALAGLTERRPDGGDSSAETDLEVDVVVLRSHQLYAISCYAGTNPENVAWKSREIARRAVQLGGDFARPAFVCLVGREEADEMQAQLRREVPVGPRVTVFGLEDLLAWTDDPPCLDSLHAFLGLDAVPPAVGEPEIPDELEHDLLVTVGGTPLPVLLAILAHAAVRPLLLHTPRTSAMAGRLSAILARRGIESVLVRATDGFDVAAVDAVLDRLPPSEAIDFTGGTKVISTRALLRHVRGAPVASATYVDARADVLRSLAPGVEPAPLPSDVTIEEMLALRGWHLEHAERIAPPPEGTVAKQAPSSRLARLARGVAAVLGPSAEIVTGARLAEDASPRRGGVDLLVRNGTRIAVVATPWANDSHKALRAAWLLLPTADDAFGEYATVAIVTALAEPDRARAERQLQRRSGGAPRVRVLADAQRAANHDLARSLTSATGLL